MKKVIHRKQGIDVKIEWNHKSAEIRLEFELLFEQSDIVVFLQIILLF